MSHVSNTISVTFPKDYGNGTIALGFAEWKSGLAVVSWGYTPLSTTLRPLFQSQHASLQLCPPSKAAWCPIRPNDPVAWDDDREAIACNCRPDKPTGARSSDLCGYLAIGPSFSMGNGRHSFQHQPL